MQHAYEGVSDRIEFSVRMLTGLMFRCGGAIGVFFLVKRCAVLYLYANNGAFTPSPYLDAHGEMDSSMR